MHELHLQRRYKTSPIFQAHNQFGPPRKNALLTKGSRLLKLLDGCIVLPSAKWYIQASEAGRERRTTPKRRHDRVLHPPLRRRQQRDCFLPGMKSHVSFERDVDCYSGFPHARGQSNATQHGWGIPWNLPPLSLQKPEPLWRGALYRR